MTSEPVTIRFSFHTSSSSVEHSYLVSSPISEPIRGKIVLPDDDNYRNLVARFHNLHINDNDVPLLGQRLSETLFANAARDIYMATRGGLRPGQRVRIVLDLPLDTPELVSVHWEYLSDPNDREPLVLHDISIVRFIGRPFSAPNAEVPYPLNVLLTAAQTHPKTDVQRELGAIKHALSALGNRVIVDVIEHLTAATLQTHLRQGFHVWHFVGHGGLGADGAGQLMLEDEHGDEAPLSTKQLAALLAGSSVRLAVLNACGSAQVFSHPMLSIAPALVSTGVAAAIAMQLNVSAETTRTFSQKFYQTLADGNQVDYAVTEGRRAILMLHPNTPDWGIPVHVTHSPDVRIVPDEPPANADLLPDTWDTPDHGVIVHKSRAAALAAIFARLRSRRFVVLHGFTGTGKSVLAREVRRRVLEKESDALICNHVILQSNHEQVNTVTRDTLVDELVRRFGLEGLREFEPDTRAHRVIELLSERTLLFILDNFESMSDVQLNDWLALFPERWYTLITSQHNLANQEERLRMVEVKITGLDTDEIDAFITQQLQYRGMSVPSNLSAFNNLINNTGANPLAIELAIGELHYRGTADQIAIELNTLQIASTEQIVQRLVERHWNELAAHPLARRMLMAAALFPDSFTEQALFAATSSSGKDIPQLIKALRGLINRSVLTIERAAKSDLADYKAEPRYTIHPLVRAYTRKKHRKQAKWVQGARRRIISWVEQYLKEATFPVSDLKALEKIPPEERTIRAALTWAQESALHESVIRIVDGVDHYYYVRGPWDQKHETDVVRIAAAQALTAATTKDSPEGVRARITEARVVAMLAQFLCTRGDSLDIEKAGDLLARLDVLRQEIASLRQPIDVPTSSIRVQIEHAFAFYKSSQKDYAAAQAIMQACLTITPEPRTDLIIATQRWLADAYLRDALDTAELDKRVKRLQEARRYYLEAKQLAENMRNAELRSIINCLIGLARVALAEGLPDNALALASDARDMAIDAHEQRYIAQSQLVIAEAHVKAKDFSSAQSAQDAAEFKFRTISLHRDRDRLKQNRQRINEHFQGREER